MRVGSAFRFHFFHNRHTTVPTTPQFNHSVGGFRTRHLVIAYFFAIATLMVIGTFSYQTVVKQESDYEYIERANANIRELNEVVSGMSLGQTELRAYYLTQNPEYLRSYNARVDSVDYHLSVLRRSVTEPGNLRRTAELDSLIKKRRTFNVQKLAVFQRRGEKYADDRFPVAASQSLVRSIDSIVFVMKTKEKEMLDDRKSTTANQTNRTLLLIGFGGLISVILLLVVFLFLHNEIRQRRKVEREVRESEQRLINFMEAVPAGIYIISPDGTPYYANEEAKKILGRGIIPEVTAENIGDMYRAFRQGTDTPYPSDQLPIVRALRGERSTISDIEIWKPDSVVPLLVTGAPIYDSEGTLRFAMAAFFDISVQKKAEQKLAESEERYRQIIESATDIIYRTDRNGRLTYVNPVGLKVFGYTEQQAIGMHYLDVITAEQLDTVKRFYLKQAATKTKQSYYEFHAVTKNGRRIVLGQNVQLLVESDRVIGFLAVARDISEKKRYEEELQEAKNAAESATLAKSQFLATMSHEIRTPMNGVIGMTDLLLQTEMNAEQREFTEIIRTSGETLLTLINDILDFSKIESGKLEMEKRPVEIQSLIEETFDLVARRAVEKRLDLVYLIEPSVPPYIIGDPVRLRQILLNLTGNAIKFTEKGEVLITVKELEKNADLSTLRFSVADTGIGIPADDVSKLFQAFSQVDASTTRKYGGTGLGLAITKRLVELMNGRVWVESTVGTGSTFHFTVTAPTGTAGESLPKKYIRGKIPELQGKRVLLVDDNRTNLNILTIQCTNWGMHARATASQNEALQWLANNDPFDIAVIDYHMPEMNGVDLTRKIRSLRPASSLPVVLFSSSGRSDFSETENKLFAAVILKPVKQGHLYSTLIDVLADRPDGGRPAARLTQPAVESLALSLPLNILVAEDNPVNQKLAIRLLQQLGYQADIAANGSVAVSMAKEKRYDVVLMDLHMPVMDGLEATKAIVQSTDRSARPTIIAMTADAMSGDREKCIDAGMDDYLSKPVRLDGLRDMLKRYGTIIHDRQKSSETGESRSAMYMRLKELLDQTDVEFLTEFVQSYPVQSEEMLLQLTDAWDRQNFPELMFAAHKLRGLALSFGADEVAEACQFIETNAEKEKEKISRESIATVGERLHASFDTLSATLTQLGIA